MNEEIDKFKEYIQSTNETKIPEGIETDENENNEIQEEEHEHDSSSKGLDSDRKEEDNSDGEFESKRYRPDSIHRKKIEEEKRKTEKEYRLRREYQLLYENEKRERQEILEKYKTDKMISDEYNNKVFESSIDSREDQLKNELKRAYEEGDPEKASEYQVELSKLHAKRETYLSMKSYSDMNQQSSHPIQEQRYVQRKAEPEVSNEFINFLGENPWFDSNSDSYHPSLAEEATKIADIVNRKYYISGRQDLIGTPEYYNKISNEMRKKYDMDFEDNSTSRQSQDHSTGRSAFAQNSKQTVSPVNPSSSGFESRRNGVETRRLSDHEKKFVRALRMTDGNGNELSDDLKYKRFIQTQMELEKIGKS